MGLFISDHVLAPKSPFISDHSGSRLLSYSPDPSFISDLGDFSASFLPAHCQLARQLIVLHVYKESSSLDDFALNTSPSSVLIASRPQVVTFVITLHLRLC